MLLIQSAYDNLSTIYQCICCQMCRAYHTFNYFFQEQIFSGTLQAMLSWVILVLAKDFRQFAYLVLE